MPLSRYLNPDGSLNLPPEGISGSIDPAGFKMSNDPGEPPRFESAPPEPLAPGDEYWDPSFGVPGMNGGLGALLWDGTNLYAGGAFTTAGGAAANHIA